MAGDVTDITGRRKPRAKKAPAVKPGTELAAPPVGAREYQLRREGKSWTEIAAELGIDASNAIHAYDAYLQRAALEMQVEDRGKALALEVARLDALQAAYWPAATVGRDLDSARLVLGIIAQRIKLLRLDEELGGALRTVVTITGTSEQYVATLKQLITVQESVDAEVVPELE